MCTLCEHIYCTVKTVFQCLATVNVDVELNKGGKSLIEIMIRGQLVSFVEANSDIDYYKN